MTEKAKSPDPAAINRTVARLHETCQQLDALTLLLDDAIAQVEAENRKSPLYAYRLKRAKRLLDSPKPEKLEKVGE